MCLKQLKSKNHDHSVIKKEPKYLSAVVKNGENEECVTNKLVEFHGPSRNFFIHIPDAVSDVRIILKNHKGKLHTFDMLGMQQIHDI